jgi:hypothetical protein
MLAESANQALLDWAIADQSLDGLRETLGEVRHVCAFVVRRPFDLSADAPKPRV